MKNSFFKRILAVCLCLCMLPVFVLADEEINDGTPVTHSAFDLSLRFNADGFPNDGAAHYQDWAKLFDKISLTGDARAQSFLSPYSRVMLDGALCLNGESKVPFEYDGYYSFRYLRSPAINNESIHFQMLNFFQFMLKGYYFMGLPTNLIAVPMYPEAAVEVFQKYAEPVSRVCGGEGSRVISYDELYALAEELSLLVNEDENDKLYYFLTSLMIDIGGDYIFLEKLAYMEDWLDYLDPEQLGMTITVEDESETWVLGETTVFEKNGDNWSFSLPDYETYVFGVTYTEEEDSCEWRLEILCEDFVWLDASFTVDGLGDPTKASGTATLEMTGDAFWFDMPVIAFQYDFSRTAETLPYDMSLTVDWLHPETEKPAIGFSYQASMEELPYTAVYNRPIDNQDDFFHLNESFMAEYADRFMPTLLAHFMPFAFEVPAGVISDLVKWMDDLGFLAFFGLE
ncbi:MAG: hypothetical protein J6K55_04000 [Clostridia bacterium]|nr:hypothetical protein [Clostridia bacterium]